MIDAVHNTHISITLVLCNGKIILIAVG